MSRQAASPTTAKRPNKLSGVGDHHHNHGEFIPLAFRSHGSMLSTAGFLFCPKNFGLANPPPCPVRQPPETEEETKEFATFVAANAVEAIIEIRDQSHAGSATPTTAMLATPSSTTRGQQQSSSSSSSTTSHFHDPVIFSDQPQQQQSLWICRAVAMTEKDAQQSHGSISVNTDLMKQVKFVSDRARGRLIARIIPDYAEAKRLYGLHSVQLSFSDQFLSRSDSMIVIESIRDLVLYVGQEVSYGGFHLRVQELFMLVESPSTSNSSSSSSKPSLLFSVQCGIVASNTRVNISSHAFVSTILIELSEEMWWPAIDGRITLNWVFERFLRQFTEQLPKYKSIPYVRVVLFGRLADAAVTVKDVYHVVTLERNRASLERLADDASYHCQLFLARLLKELPTVKEAKRLFVSSKNCNFLEAVNLVLHTYAAHNIDRRLDTTGQAITIVSAGKCLYRVANDMSQITSARMLDIGVKLCHVVVIGRPPLHSTPLFEFSFDDPSLRSQYHLQLEHDLALKHVYVKPDWIRCFFFHAAPYVGGMTPKCELLDRDQWEATYPIADCNMSHQHHQHHNGSMTHSSATFSTISSSSSSSSRLSHACAADHLGDAGRSVYYPGLSLPPVKNLPLVITPIANTRSSPLSSTLNSRENTNNNGVFFARAGSDSSSSINASGGTQRRSYGCLMPLRRSADEVAGIGGGGGGGGVSIRVKTRWYIRDRDRRIAVGLNILDTDVTAGNLTLSLHVECCGAGGGGGGAAMPAAGVVWSRSILQSDEAFDLFISCFTVHFDDMIASGSFFDTSSSSNLVQKRSSLLGGTSSSYTSPNRVAAPLSPSSFFFNPKKMFARRNCFTGTGDETTLYLDAVPVEAAAVCKCPEEVLFCIRKELLEVHFAAAAVNSSGGGGVVENAAIVSTSGSSTPPLRYQQLPSPQQLLDMLILPGTSVIAYMQVQCAILFPVQPINPYQASSQVIPGIMRYSSKHVGSSYRGGGGGGGVGERDDWPVRRAGSVRPVPLSSGDGSAQKAPQAAAGEEQPPGANSSSSTSAVVAAVEESRFLTIDNLYKARWVYTRSSHMDNSGATGTASSSYQRSMNANDMAASTWEELCCCELLPLEGEKPRYGAESMEKVSAAYHVPPGLVKAVLKELIVQRALQQYQVCSGLCAAFSAFSKPPSTTKANTSNSNSTTDSEVAPAVLVEMTIGHQHHTITYEEDTNTIRITRSLHRGMYLLPQATNIVSYSYSLWNYLCDELQVREMDIEAQTGGKNAYPWESLDRWLVMNPAVRSPMPPSTAGLKQRQICFSVLPEDPAHPASFEEFDAFISRRFSSRLRPRHGGKGVWKAYDGPIQYSLGVEGDEEDAAGGQGTSNSNISSSNAHYHHSERLETVVLEHVAQDEDYRMAIDPTTGKTLYGEKVQDRTMSMDVSLSAHYTPLCAFTLEVSWLVASSTLIADWANAFVMNAPRSRLKVVRVPCLCDVQLGNPLQAVHVVEPMPDYHLDSTFRERLLRLLIEKYSYYPDTVIVNRNCRLIHASGLSFVDSLRDRVVWCENYLQESGSSMQQFAQYKEFREVERTVRLAVADESRRLAT